MKKIVILLICSLLTASLYAENNSIFEGTTPDSTGKTPTQTIELTINGDLYRYSVGFSTNGSKPSQDITENTKLELSSDDKTIAVNTSDDLYVWWDIMTADAFDVTLELDGPLTQQPEEGGASVDSPAKINFSVTGAVQDGEIKPEEHTTTPIDIVSNGTDSSEFLTVVASDDNSAHTYHGEQKLTLATLNGELANMSEAKHTANLILTVTGHQ